MTQSDNDEKIYKVLQTNFSQVPEAPRNEWNLIQEKIEAKKPKPIFVWSWPKVVAACALLLIALVTYESLNVSPPTEEAYAMLEEAGYFEEVFEDSELLEIDYLDIVE